MDDITVSKAELIETLKDNREMHRTIFLQGQKVYRAKMIEELDRALDEAKNGGAIRRAFALPVPEDHTEDYDTVISMLEWDEGAKVVLSYHDFQTYVENKWGWRASFAANTESYTAG